MSRSSAPYTATAARSAGRPGESMIVRHGACIFSERAPTERFSFAERRLWEMGKLFRARHGEILPGDVDEPTDSYLFAVAQTIHAWLDEHDDRLSWLVEWFARVTPWMDDSRKVASKLLARMHPRRKQMTGEALGRTLSLSYDERKRLGITTIAPANITKKEFDRRRQKEKRERDRERAVRKRIADGGTKRAESLSRTKPWEAENISRKTWERRRQKRSDDANSSPGGNTQNDADSSRGCEPEKGAFDANSSLGGLATELRHDANSSPHIVLLQEATELRHSSQGGSADLTPSASVGDDRGEGLDPSPLVHPNSGRRSPAKVRPKTVEAPAKTSPQTSRGQSDLFTSPPSS